MLRRRHQRCYTEDPAEAEALLAAAQRDVARLGAPGVPAGLATRADEASAPASKWAPRAGLPAPALAPEPTCDLELRALQGLRLPTCAGPGQQHRTVPPAPGLVVTTLRPDEYQALVTLSRTELTWRDCQWGANIERDLWPAERTRAGLCDSNVLERVLDMVMGHLGESWRGGCARRLADKLEEQGALSASMPPIVAPSLTSTLGLVTAVEGLSRRVSYYISGVVTRDKWPRLTDALRVIYAEGQRARLLAGAERIAAEAKNIEARGITLGATRDALAHGDAASRAALETEIYLFPCRCAFFLFPNR